MPRGGQSTGRLFLFLSPRPAKLSTPSPLAASVPATYGNGTSTLDTEGTLQWADGDADRLVFENESTRTVIVYRSGENVKDELVRMAESMLQL